jgi:hypothetical protein
MPTFRVLGMHFLNLTFFPLTAPIRPPVHLTFHLRNPRPRPRPYSSHPEHLSRDLNLKRWSFYVFWADVGVGMFKFELQHRHYSPLLFSARWTMRNLRNLVSWSLHHQRTDIFVPPHVFIAKLSNGVATYKKGSMLY